MFTRWPYLYLSYRFEPNILPSRLQDFSLLVATIYVCVVIWGGTNFDVESEIRKTAHSLIRMKNSIS